MAFNEKIRAWVHRATGGQSMNEYYSEKKGWTRSPQKSDEVHHITPESDAIYRGQNPNAQVPMPLSREEHTGKGIIYDSQGPRLAGYGEPGHSMHPDMGYAREAYRGGDKEAFKKAVEKHIVAAQKGERINNTDPRLDGYLEERMSEMLWNYAVTHPEDPFPGTPKVSEKHKRHWTDIPEGKRGYPEDEPDKKNGWGKSSW